LEEISPHGEPAFDTRELRQVLGAFVTGVTVITTVDKAGRPYGLTANSFSSVSLNPPLILWSQSLTAPSYPVFRDAERFAISILAEHQADISQKFSRAGADKFEGVAIEKGIGGIPLIRGAAAHLECRCVTSYPGGDHAVFLGEVERIAQSSAKPLAFGRGRYLVTNPRDLGEFSIDIGFSSLGHLHAVRIATPVVADLAAALKETVCLAVWGNMGPTVIRWEESERPVSNNLRTGVVLPLLTSATGIAFGSYLPWELTREVIERELAQGRGGLRTMEDVETLFAETRAVGLGRVSATTETFADMYDVPITAVSAPVFDRTGMMILALTVVGHGDRLDVSTGSDLTATLGEAAASLSRHLGFKKEVTSAGAADHRNRD
jgi:flavin reductase (DIM6/NTAB) family NADH-FMN oxidoreductase RutF